MPDTFELSKLFAVNGIVAVITGGGTGIGLMMAKALASNGAHRVFILGRRMEKLEAAASECPQKCIVPLQCDVTSKEQLAAAAARVQNECGHVNLLVCNSGVAGPVLKGLNPNPTLKQFKDYAWGWSESDMNNAYALNNTAVFFTSIAFLELLDAGNRNNNTPDISSQIVIIGSIASFLRIVVTGFAYVSSKAAAVSLAKALSTYLAPYGIRCNALAPGLFPSELTEGLLLNSADGSKVERSFIPVGRVGSDEDMGGTMLYMASRAGAFLNGCVIVLDGGRIGLVPASY